jgi:hypothetical protein
MKILASTDNKFKLHVKDIWMVVTPAPEYEVFMDDDLKGDYVTTPEPVDGDFLDQNGEVVIREYDLYRKIKNYMNDYFADISPGEYNCSLDVVRDNENIKFKNVKYKRVADSEYLDYDLDDYDDYEEDGYPEEDFPGGHYPAKAKKSKKKKDVHPDHQAILDAPNDNTHLIWADDTISVTVTSKTKIKYNKADLREALSYKLTNENGVEGVYADNGELVVTFDELNKNFNKMLSYWFKNMQEKESKIAKGECYFEFEFISYYTDVPGQPVKFYPSQTLFNPRKLYPGDYDSDYFTTNVYQRKYFDRHYYPIEVADFKMYEMK